MSSQASSIGSVSSPIEEPVAGRLAAADATQSKHRDYLGPALRAICLFWALCQMWVSRAALDPDGISYSDIAKAYLRGDWHMALNSYWSPFYSWLLAVGYVLFRPSFRWEIFVSHVINFLGFAALLFAWEWLFREWQAWRGLPANRSFVQIAGYAVVTWAGLHLVNLGFTSADMEVAAITVATGAMLIRIRRGAAKTRDFVFLGAALGLGFLAKAAFEAVIPLVLLEVAILLHSLRDRRLYIAAAVTFLVPLPFITALSIEKGHFVVNDTGWLNYSWQVTGMSVEGYKENAYWPTSVRHPITMLVDSPRATGFESHPVGTTPLHFDPPWWCEGYPVRIDLARQLFLIRTNFGYYITRFALCPAIVFVILCFLWGPKREMGVEFLKAWFIWIPAVATLAAYSLVYVLNRYIAGAFCLLAFAFMAAGWRIRLPRWIAAAGIILTVALCAKAFRPEFVQTPRQVIKDLRGKQNRFETANITIAENLKQAGLKAGDRVALIGNSIGVPWLSVLNGVTVADVPETIKFDDRRLGRPQGSTFEKADVYWRSGPAAQKRVLDAFRREGARWVIASNVPKWADTNGWSTAGELDPGEGERSPKVLYRKID